MVLRWHTIFFFLTVSLPLSSRTIYAQTSWRLEHTICHHADFCKNTHGQGKRNWTPDLFLTDLPWTDHHFGGRILWHYWSSEAENTRQGRLLGFTSLHFTQTVQEFHLTNSDLFLLASNWKTGEPSQITTFKKVMNAGFDCFWQPLTGSRIYSSPCAKTQGRSHRAFPSSSCKEIQLR